MAHQENIVDLLEVTGAPLEVMVVLQVAFCSVDILLGTTKDHLEDTVAAHLVEDMEEAH